MKHFWTFNTFITQSPTWAPQQQYSIHVFIALTMTLFFHLADWSVLLAVYLFPLLKTNLHPGLYRNSLIWFVLTPHLTQKSIQSFLMKDVTNLLKPAESWIRPTSLQIIIYLKTSLLSTPHTFLWTSSCVFSRSH